MRKSLSKQVALPTA